MESTTYEADFDLKKKFAVSELNTYEKLFKSVDTDGNGTMNRTELEGLMKNLGHRDISEDNISALMEKIDIESDGKITFSEFLVFIDSYLNVSEPETETDGGKVTSKGLLGAKHTYSLEETECFAKVINE